MPAWLPSIPYPPTGQKGFWDPVTSTLQWCEEDYYATYYAAELVNTLTNLLFMYLAYEGVRSCRKQHHDTVFIVAYWGMGLVGVGSFMFHSTLKYTWQLVDELNMIYTTCLIIYASLSWRRSKQVSTLIGVGLTTFCIALTVYYHFSQDPVFHQTVYAILTVFIIVKSAWDMESTLRPSLRKTTEKDRLAKQKRGEVVKSRVEQEYENERDMEILKGMWRFIIFGVATFLCGFALWAIDNETCSSLRAWRRAIGMPWGFFLELHGWWHLMTGLGAYCWIMWGCHLRHVLNGKQEEYALVWPSWFTLPELVHKDNRSSHPVNYTAGHAKEYLNAHANVHLNGKAKN